VSTSALEKAQELEKQKQAVLQQGADEALAMRDYLVRRGVPVDKIVVDSLGVDTWATAKNAIAYMKSHDMSSAMVVTQYFHIPRAIVAFKKNGVDRVSGASPQFFEARDIYSMFREVPAIVWYGVRMDHGTDK